MKNFQQILIDHETSFKRYKRDKGITMVHMFMNYRYKKRGKLMWVKNKHANSDHKYSLNFKKWVTIMSIYYKYVLQFMMEGKTYNIKKLGSFRLARYKTKSYNINWKRTLNDYGIENTDRDKKKKLAEKANYEAIKLAHYSNYKLKGHRIVLDWNKKGIRLPHIKFWGAKVPYSLNLYIFKYFMDNPHEVDKLPILKKYVKLG